MSRSGHIFPDIMWRFPFLYLLLLLSCQNSLEDIEQTVGEKRLPDMSGEHAMVYYSDSAVIQLRMEAPLVERYASEDDPVTYFPKGVKAVFYGKTGKEEATLTAQWGARYEKKDLWEVRGKVTYVNVSGEKIQTEQAFWNERKEQIYSDKYTRFTDANQNVLIGEKGFDAKEDLSEWKMRQNRKSQVIVKE